MPTGSTDRFRPLGPRSETSGCGRIRTMVQLIKVTPQRARDATQIKCVCQQCAVANLAPGPRAHEPPQLGMAFPCTLSGLVLKAAERLELALNSKQPLDRGNAKRADQFVFEVRVAHEKSKRLAPARLRFVPSATRSRARQRCCSSFASTSPASRTPSPGGPMHPGTCPCSSRRRREG